MEFKILCYNVLYGFHDQGPAPDFKTGEFREDRLKAARKAVKKENPHILAITEACFGEPNSTGKLMDYKSLFGYEYGAYVGYYGHWGNCLLSKYPIKKIDILTLGRRRALRCHLDVGPNNTLTIDVVHYDTDISDKDRISITSPLIRSVSGPYILTGDFNALSDEDNYDRERLVRGLRGYLKEKTEQEVDRSLQREFIPWLRAQGLKDGFEDRSKREFTFPTDFLYQDKSCAMRLDYFFLSKDIRVHDAYVVKNRFSNQASDHYPICGKFVIWA